MRTTISLLALIACTADPASTTPTTPTTTTPTLSDDCSAAVTVDATGGVLSHLDATLTVPADALAAATDLELCLLATEAPASPEPALAGLWEVRPVGTAFALPATLELPHDSPPDPVTLVTRTDDGRWRPDLGLGAELADTVAAPVWRADQAYVSWRHDDQPITPVPDALDVLLVIDNSCSMQDNQDRLGLAAPDLMAALDGSTLDWHVGVVSTDLDNARDSGQLREWDGALWADPAMADPTSWLADAANLGVSGSGIERGLGAVYLALEVLRDTDNAGFRRPEAPLEVVVLTDEKDQTLSSLITQNEFIDWFDMLTPCPEQANFSGLIRMTGPDRGAEYAAISGAVGGEIYDIDITSYSDPMGELAARGVGGPQMLDQPVDEPTLGVWQLPADGSEPLPVDGWTFDPASQFLTLGAAAAPAGCPAIVASYLPL